MKNMSAVTSILKSGKRSSMHSFRQLLRFGHLQDFSFSLIPPLLKKNLETNDTSFESPYREGLESGKKLGVASP